MQAVTMRSVLHSRRAFFARSDALLRSRRSFAVPAVSESSPKEEKRSNRISRKERRQMLQMFVERYRASNAGRFPTITHAQKEIGGSYYTVREVIQELKYNDKVFPLKSAKHANFGTRPDVVAGWSEAPLIKDRKADEPSSQLALESNQRIQSNKEIVEGTENFRASRQTSFEVQSGEADGLSAVKESLVSVDLEKALVEESIFLTKETIQSSRHTAEGTENCSLGRQTSSKDQIDKELVMKDSLSFAIEKLTDKIEDSTEDQDSCVSMKLKTEVNTSETMVHDLQGSSKDESSSADSLISAELEMELNNINTLAHDLHGTSEDERSLGSAKGGKQNSEDISKSDKLTGNNSRTIAESASSTKGWSIWGNLKSLADGIVNLWRK